jgi:hypothetical protein
LARQRGAGAQSEHDARSLHQGKHSDFFRNTFDAPPNIATQHATSYEAVVPFPTQRRREVIPSSDEGASSNVTTHNSKEGIKGDKKRCKQHLQGAATTTDHDDGNDGKAGGSGVRRSLTTTRSDKCQARLPTDHFKRLMEKACPNHTFPSATSSRIAT